MRERSQTTPRRRRAGPKQALPVESHYNIDNTEDIYGTTLLPSQRCYVDPWDLENYDYVRKKMDVDVSPGALPDYETALDYEQASQSPSPTSAPGYGYGSSNGNGNGPVLASTMPRPHTKRLSRSQCQLECCRLPSHSRSNRKEPLYSARSEVYGAPPSRYDDYMATMTRQLHLDDQDEQEALYAEQRQIYNGYGGFSSASSTEQPSSIGGDEMPSMSLPRRAATLQRRSMPSHSKDNNANYSSGYGTAPHPRRKRSGAAPTAKSMALTQMQPPPPPQIEFPAPPPLSPAYEYCNPYSTMPYCSLPDCAECQHQAKSLIYAAPSTLYSTLAGARAAKECDTPSDLSLYAGIYARKFGLSKKGLLQIDYSCSWDDLDRVMGRQY